MFNSELVNIIREKFKLVESRIKKYESIFDSCGDDEKICLQFYYAFMPVSDMAAYDAELFLKIIRQTLKVKKMNIFNENIPDEIFLNYVLQYRTNNENIEFHREIFFDELYPRIKNLSAEDAVKEVNYWCFEKATYASTDPRTVSPLTIIRNTVGRCGEESTFTVSALRSVGIPARQIYTPLWAHSDSNHAWVEAYVNGEWKFLGACEPDCELNRGWFISPASRGMLMNTRVFSTVTADESVVYKTEKFSEINLTSNYADTKNFIVKVKNANENVKVAFEIPNFGNLNPIANLKLNESGEASLITGHGNIHLHISDGTKYLSLLADARTSDGAEVDFSDAVKNETETVSFKYIPPHGRQSAENAPVPEDIKNEHERRITEGTRIRKEFENTFINNEKGVEISKKYPAFREDIVKVLGNSKGNYPEITKFLDENINVPLKYKILLLNALRPKDITDITADILKEHLIYAMLYKDNFYEEDFAKYVLNPRVGVEMIWKYREFVNNYFDEKTKKEFTENPRKIYEYLDEHITDATSEDYGTISASVTGLLELGFGSLISRKIAFVAICRSLGIAARFNPVDSELEFFDGANFIKIADEVVRETSKLTIKRKNPEADGRVSVSKLVDGVYKPLRFGFGRRDMTQGRREAPPERRGGFPALTEADLEEGFYRVLASTRLSDGSTLMNKYFVEMQKGKDLTLEIEIPTESIAMPSVTVKDFSFATDSGRISLKELLTEENNILAFVEPSKEPTEHLFNELLARKNEIIAKKVKIILISQSDGETLTNAANAFSDIDVLYTNGTEYADYLSGAFGIAKGSYPLTLLLDRNFTSSYYCSGYSIGSINMILKLC